MKKGFYFIGINDYDNNGDSMFIPELEEGSVEYYGKLYIHRKKENRKDRTGWRVSHRNTGAAIICNVSLASARLLANKLQGFRLWDIKTYEGIKEVIAEGESNPESSYHHELKQIRIIRKLRA